MKITLVAAGNILQFAMGCRETLVNLVYGVDGYIIRQELRSRRAVLWDYIACQALHSPPLGCTREVHARFKNLHTLPNSLLEKFLRYHLSCLSANSLTELCGVAFIHPSPPCSSLPFLKASVMCVCRVAECSAMVHCFFSCCLLAFLWLLSFLFSQRKKQVEMQ